MKYVIIIALLLTACSDTSPKLTHDQYWDIINKSEIIEYCKDKNVLIRRYEGDMLYISAMIKKKVNNRNNPCEEIK